MQARIDFLDRQTLTSPAVGRPADSGERTFLKLALGILIGLILLVFLVWGGYRIYAAFESKHLARRAAGYLSGGDLRQAALSARRALQINPSNVEALRVAAEAAERANDRSALGWRRQVMELEPNSVTDKIAFANCSLQFKEIAVAAKTLSQFDDETRKSAEFHAAAARLAEATRDPAEAERQWSEAVRLEPQNKSFQLESALYFIKVDRREKREAALETLRQLRSEPRYRAAATRALIGDGIKHRLQGQPLLEIARELQGYPEANLSDRLLYLDMLRQLRDPDFPRHLTETQNNAASNPADLAAVLSWMNANRLGLLALDYTRKLSPEVANKWPIPLAIAESYDRLGDWDKLEESIKDKTWEAFDFLRHAYLSRSFREQGRPGVADREWAQAQKMAGNQPQFLTVLSQTVLGWGWKKESLDLLWTLSKQPGQLEPLEILYQEYIKSGDTPNLYRVLVRLVELLPNDRRIQNNLAQLRLLLNADVDRARQSAADLYNKEPSNPAYASTYAFALYTKGDATEGLKIMNRLSEKDLSDPGLATYYGVILAAAGETEKARHYLTLVDSARLLPEEKQLIAKAEDLLK